MKKIFTLFLFILSYSFTFSQAWDWTKAGPEAVSSIAIDNQQFFVSALSGGALTKRERNGSLVWQKAFVRSQGGGARPAPVYGVVTDNDGNIYTSNNAYDTINHVFTGEQGAVSKFDFNGNLVWSRVFKWLDDSNIERGDITNSAIARDEQDNIYVTGIAGPGFYGPNFSSYNKRIVFGTDTLSIPGTGTYLIVAKVDKNGQRQWIKSFLYTMPANAPHRTNITSIAVKNNQVAIAGTSNLTNIYFDTYTVTGGKGTNFLVLLNGADGGVKWVKDIRFLSQQIACIGGCDAPTARVLFNDHGKLVFTSAFMDTLRFGGITYNANNRKQYYISQYDTSGTEDIFKIFPNDNLGNGNPAQSIPFYTSPAIAKAGNAYYYHVLNHLYKLDSAYNIIWTSTNSTSYGDHMALTADPSGQVIGQSSSFSGTSAQAGQEDVVNPVPGNTYYYQSRINSNYNIVSGYVFYDINGNGIKDPGEQPVKNMPVGIQPGNRFISLTDTTGLYECLSDTGSFTFNLLRFPPYYILSPAAGHSISMNSFNQHITGKDFALRPLPGIVDLSADLAGITINRPGFLGNYRLAIHNKGTTIQTGTCTVRLSDKIQFNFAAPAPASVSPDSLVFNYVNLSPGQSQFFDIHYIVKTTTTFTDSIVSYATVYPVATDTVKADNYDTLRMPVRASYDPNDKQVDLNGDVSIERKGQALEYTIRFQNTGNDTAFNVRVTDTLSAKIDVASFELVSSTHSVQPLITGDKVLTFYFDNILLADSVHNEPLSHGMVKFRMKPITTVQVNDVITNRAAIYFDYNAPVLTNTVQTRYVQPVVIAPVVNLGADTARCGGSITLNAGNTGARFLWNTGDTTQSITATISGAYWVRVTNSYGIAARDTIQVTINALPIVNLGPDIIRCGGSVILNAGNTGSSYLWSNGALTQSITATVSGTYSVRVTNANGCIGYDTVQVTINARPVVNLGNDTSFCTGSGLVLDAGNSGASYLWNNNTTNRTLTVSQAGIYTVRVTNAAGCIAADTIQVSLRPLPVITFSVPDTIYANDTPVPLTATPAGGQYTGAGISNGQFNPAATGAGTYALQYRFTDAFGCSAAADGRIVVVAPVNRINVYPNPNRGSFSVVLASNLRNTTLTIVTPSGQVAGQYTLYAILQQLRLSLRPGIYYLRFRNKDFTETKRMIVW